MRFGIKTVPQHTTWKEVLTVWQAADEIEQDRQTGEGDEQRQAHAFAKARLDETRKAKQAGE